MALNSRQLPVCDSCGKEWLPDEGPARDDPRSYSIQRWLAGEPPVRCGKCKTPYWDRAFTGVTSKATLAAFIERVKTEPFTIHNEGMALPLPEVVITSCNAQDPEFVEAVLPELVKAVLRQRCRHGLLSCPHCNKEKAA